MDVKTNSTRIHQGNNLKKLREAQGIDKNEISEKLNLPPESIWEYESKERIDDSTLMEFSKVLNIPLNIIKNLDSNPSSYIVDGNTIESHSSCISIFGNNITNYPVDRIVELEKDKDMLFERLLKLEQDKNEELKMSINELKIEITKLKNQIDSQLNFPSKSI